MRELPAIVDHDTTAECALGAHVRTVWRGLAWRVWPILLIAAFGWVCFSAFRVGLLVSQRAKLADVSAGELARCLGVGFRYDSVPMGVLLLPLVLLLMLPSSRRLAGRWFRRLIAAYMTVTVLAVVAVEIIGAAFFVRFGARLNLLAVEYANDAREVIGYIWSAYPAWAFVLAIVVGVPLMYWALAKLTRRPPDPVPATVRLPVAAALLGGCLLAILGWSFYHPLTMNTAHGEGLRSPLISELARNNAYTLGHAVATLLDHGNERTLYPFPPREEAHAVTAGLLIQEGDRPLNHPRNPLWRSVGSGPVRPFNVVVILMEGMTGPNVGCMGNPDSGSPVLDRLADEGLFFDRCYAVGARTNRGIVAALCGYPDLGGPSILRRSQAIGQFLTLPGLFAQRGYRTSFLYGGDPDFDNMAVFFRAGGVERIIGQQEFAARGITEPATCWGLADEVLLDRAHELFQSHGDERFFSIVLTVSNHEPFDVPLGDAGLVDSDDLDVKKRNGIRYADHALGKFFDQARQADYFHRTLFILVADHGRFFDTGPILDIPGYRVPLIFYGPGLTDSDDGPLLPPRRIGTVCSQTDIAPTLLGLTSGQFEHCFMGRNLLRAASGSGFALLHDNERLALVTDRDAVMLLPTRAPRYVTLGETGLPTTPADAATHQVRADELTHMMLSFYRTVLDLYFDRAFGPPASE